MAEIASDGESDAGAPPSYSTEQFKESVKEFIRIHDRLAEIRRDTNVLNKRKKKLSEVIVAFMNTNNKDFCNLGNEGTLEMKTSKSKLALNNYSHMSLYHKNFRLIRKILSN